MRDPTGHRRRDSRNSLDLSRFGVSRPYRDSGGGGGDRPAAESKPSHDRQIARDSSGFGLAGACQNDVALYNNRDTCCAGFFVCKTNNKTVHLWQSILEHMNSLPTNTNEQDQSLLNHYLDKIDIKYKTLSHKFFTLARHKPELWDQKNNYFDFTIPDDIIAYHANWTHGIENKIALLNYVQSKIKQ